MESILFLVLALVFIVLFYFANGRNSYVLIINILWAFFIGSLSLMGIFGSNPPVLIIAIVGTVIVNVIIFKKICLRHLNLPLLLTIQSLRIVVELFLYKLYLDKMIPKLMTFEGLNYDIVVGAFAVLFLVISIFRKSILRNWIFVLWNYAGIISLFSIVTIGVLSSPVPIQMFEFNQPNVAVLVFPYALLPTIIVPIAVVSHLLMLSARNR